LAEKSLFTHKKRYIIYGRPKEVIKMDEIMKPIVGYEGLYSITN
jgi:hypothetical protein